MTIRYPIARDEDGAAVHIDAWDRGQSVTCFGYGEDLVGRMPHDGIKPTAHFAHKADSTCSGETALHKAAKAAIVDAHAKGTLGDLEWECPRCKRSLHVTDLRSLVLREEARPCAGVVSDVLGLDSDLDGAEPRVAIEVVVTHDLESETLDRYRTQGLRVYSLKPSWGIVGDLVRGADALRVDHRLGVVDAACEGCQQVLREKQEWETRALAQRAQAWWNAWNAAWKSLGSEVARRLFDQHHASRLRSLTWWTAWSRVWPRIADHIVSSWWVEWRRLWRELGAQYARPYDWLRAWEAAWSTIGKQYAQEEVERARRRAEDVARESARRWVWWPAWLQVWSNIGQRESGMMAAWRPICRQCRQDLTADHRCP